ncbi:MAG: hypothetical protein BM555_00315 [Crocinitomix sp. MedPE-SWsnd]|nr:MAG: hypothetical protein BM555_00315 [Crocinitomix sp. MedPE-SWsnd]
MGKFSQLISQIEGFIKKYYKNEMVKGVILFASVFLLSYGVVTGLEYMGRFGGGVRLTLLLSFIGINLFLLAKFILIPILKLNKVGRRLTLKEASVMLGSIFPEVGDKLSNTLQFNDEKANTNLNLELVNASIEQRASSLSAVPFSTAIDFKENKKYLKFLLPILILIGVVAIANPNWFLDGSERIVNFNTEYVEEAPFDFVMLSADETKEGDNYTLQIKLEGDEIPDEVKITSNKGTYNLIKKSNVLFEYEFANVDDKLSFVCEANGFESEEFDVGLLKMPVVQDMTLEAMYPKHTGKKNEIFQNTGDVTVPEGTLLKWSVSVKNMDQLEANFNDTTILLNTSISNSYNFQGEFHESDDYRLILSSDQIKNADSLDYSVNVVKDEYPTISIEETVDSTNEARRFIEGKVSDDYGFRSLFANLKVIGKDTSYTVRKSLKVNPSANNQLFSYGVDLSAFDLGPGDRVEYSFVVTDNDAINNYKSSSTSKKVFAVPEMDELDNVLTDQANKLEKDMDESLKEAQDLKKKIKDIKSTLMNKPNTDWKDKQSMENLLDMKKQFDLNLEKLKSDFEKNKKDQENYLEPDEEFLEKQEKLQELLEALMDDEMKELFEELEKLMEEMNKDKLIENLDEMEMESETMEEKMDRTLELFKNMELDKKLENLEEQLRDLKEQQDDLKDKMDDKSQSNEDLKKEQEDINKKFDEIQKDIDEVKEKNQDLEKPRDLDFDEEQEQNLDEELDDAKESLEDGKKSKSQKSQEKASDMMEQMAEDIAAMQSQSQQQKQQEDMDALRYLLENIVALSHDEEDLIGQYKKTRSSDPYYLELNREQLQVEKATDIVRDSLLALSSRVHQLSTFINDELSELNYNLDKSLKYSEERNTNKLLQYQQYAMTDYNDLALMLSEVLDQMQQSAASQMPGSGQCDKPGGSGKGSAGAMSMEQMKKAMQDQIGKMKGGKKPGGEDGQGKDGKNGKPGGGQGQGSIPGMSTKDQVKMAAQQAQIRESLKKLKQELNKDGSGMGNGLNDIIKDLDDMEEDLLNGDLGNNYIKRQEDILTRLLESDKAMRERGFSEEREAKEGKNVEEGNLIEFTEYNKKKDAEVEFLRSLPVGLRVYYKTMVNEYFNSVNN